MFRFYYSISHFHFVFRLILELLIHCLIIMGVERFFIILFSYSHFLKCTEFWMCILQFWVFRCVEYCPWIRFQPRTGLHRLYGWDWPRSWRSTCDFMDFHHDKLAMRRPSASSSNLVIDIPCDTLLLPLVVKPSLKYWNNLILCWNIAYIWAYICFGWYNYLFRSILTHTKDSFQERILGRWGIITFFLWCFELLQTFIPFRLQGDYLFILLVWTPDAFSLLLTILCTRIILWNCLVGLIVFLNVLSNIIKLGYRCITWEHHLGVELGLDHVYGSFNLHLGYTVLIDEYCRRTKWRRICLTVWRRHILHTVLHLLGLHNIVSIKICFT